MRHDGAIVLFKDYAPSGWDGPMGGGGSNVLFWDRDRANSLMNWIVAPVIKTRDTGEGSLERSNWEVLLKRLKKNSPEGRGWSIEGFNHWACGYYDMIIAKPKTKAWKIVEEVSKKLYDYPVLDENDWSEREFNAANDYWSRISVKERLYYIQNYCEDVSIFEARHPWTPNDNTGELIRALVE